MKLAIISGSHRQNSQSSKVAKFAQDELKFINPDFQTYFLNLAEADIPLYDDNVRTLTGKWKTLWEPIEDELASSDGFIIITPEWNGMVPAKLKNLFLLPQKNCFSHKPCLLIGVSSGTGGSYPLAELRMTTHKNTKINYIPEQVIVRDVVSVLNSANPESESDSRIRERIKFCLRVLVVYTENFNQIRQSNINLNKFPHGM